MKKNCKLECEPSHAPPPPPLSLLGGGDGSFGRVVALGPLKT